MIPTFGAALLGIFAGPGIRPAVGHLTEASQPGDPLPTYAAPLAFVENRGHWPSDVRYLSGMCQTRLAALSAEHDGSLTLDTAAGPIRQVQGMSWQFLESSGTRSVPCRIRLVDELSFTFVVENRNPSLPLQIDPGLVWSTYLGSGNNGGT